MTDAWPLVHGPRPEKAASVLVLLHGRGATAAGMRPLAEAVASDETSALAPQAPGGSWYPDRFLAPREANEPWLSSALGIVDELVRGIVAAGMPRDRIFVAGFSQGACLAVEYVARKTGRFAGCVAFAGALVGPDPETGGYVGDLRETPVHLAVGDRDGHVPPPFVEASARVLRRMGGTVSVEIRAGMGHGIHPEDVDVLRAMLLAAGR